MTFKSKYDAGIWLKIKAGKRFAYLLFLPDAEWDLKIIIQKKSEREDFCCGFLRL